MDIDGTNADLKKIEATLAKNIYFDDAMEVYTNQPGLQFYGGNFFDGNSIGKCGDTFKYREAIALETQKFPDGPNQPQFPSVRLNPDEEYYHVCIYKFSVK